MHHRDEVFYLGYFPLALQCPQKECAQPVQERITFLRVSKASFITAPFTVIFASILKILADQTVIPPIKRKSYSYIAVSQIPLQIFPVPQWAKVLQKEISGLEGAI